MPDRVERHRLFGQAASALMALVLAVALWFVLSVWAGPGGGPGAASQSGVPFTMGTLAPGVVPTLVPFSAEHNPGVADLLAKPPAAGGTVEVDAFFNGAGAVPRRGGPLAPGDQVVCPMPWGSALTDRPFPAFLSYLNGTTSNNLPDDAPWLIAALPEQTQPGGGRFTPDLPYHARLRGHLGDPAFAGCEHAGRIFIVEQVVQVYEQDPPDPTVYQLKVPTDYASWPRYHDEALGYSLPYPPDWQVQRLDDSTIVLGGPLWPGHPVVVHVQAGETHYDQYDLASIPPLLQGDGWGIFEQGGWPFDQASYAIQGLAGHQVQRGMGTDDRSIAVVLSGNGKTYELALMYPTGFAASQELLNIYTAIVQGFRLDTDPGPAPTAPVKQELGPGPFLTQAEVLVEAERRSGSELELISAELMSEAEARRRAQTCGTFMGHPDGVWLLVVRGQFEGQARTMQLYLEAASGEQLCGEEILTGSPASTAAPLPLAPPPAPTATPVGLSPDIAPEVTQYTVVPGDTCLKIAEDHGVSVEQLIAFNHLPEGCAGLSVGQVLSIPQAAPTPAPTATLSTDIWPPPVATLQAIGLEDRGCPNPAGVEADSTLTADEALDVMRAFFSDDPIVALQARDPALWPAGTFAPPALTEEELQASWFQPPRPAAESPYAGALRVHCGEETLAASWTVVYCRGQCDAPALSASLMEDYFLLRRSGEWLVWYVWP